LNEWLNDVNGFNGGVGLVAGALVGVIAGLLF
jgi:hypothetical protein